MYVCIRLYPQKSAQAIAFFALKLAFRKSGARYSALIFKLLKTSNLIDERPLEVQVANEPLLGLFLKPQFRSSF